MLKHWFIISFKNSLLLRMMYTSCNTNKNTCGKKHRKKKSFIMNHNYKLNVICIKFLMLNFLVLSIEHAEHSCRASRYLVSRDFDYPSFGLAIQVGLLWINSCYCSQQWAMIYALKASMDNNFQMYLLN